MTESITVYTDTVDDLHDALTVLSADPAILSTDRVTFTNHLTRTSETRTVEQWMDSLHWTAPVRNGAHDA